MNTSTSEALIVIIALLILSKRIIGTHTLIHTTDPRWAVSSAVLSKALLGYLRARITLDGTKQSILCTDVHQLTILQHSGGLENGKKDK